MTVNTAFVLPWSADTVDLITNTITHVTRAWVTSTTGELTPLDIEDGTLTFDETRAPRVQATITCRFPDDAALLSRIDPRQNVRLRLDVGYQRPDGAEEVFQIGDLGLRSRRIERPADTMTLTAASDEALVIDGSPTATGTVTDASTTGAISAVLNQVLTVTPVVDVGGPTGPAVSGVLFDDRWDAIVDLADRIEKQVFDDGMRTWHINSAPLLDDPALELTVGEGGTIIDSDSGVDRDEGWYNYVWLRYEWTDGSNVDHTIDGKRRITTGPYAATTGNIKVFKQVRNVATTQTEANSAGDALVARTVTRGRSFSLTAISAYWLRPGHTVDITLPLGDTEQHLVTAVAFDLRAGTMRVTTRLPDNTGTIGA